MFQVQLLSGPSAVPSDDIRAIAAVLLVAQAKGDTDAVIRDRFLKTLACPYKAGFDYCRPEDLNEAERWLKDPVAYSTYPIMQNLRRATVEQLKSRLLALKSTGVSESTAVLQASLEAPSYVTDALPDIYLAEALRQLTLPSVPADLYDSSNVTQDPGASGAPGPAHLPSATPPAAPSFLSTYWWQLLIGVGLAGVASYFALRSKH